MKGPEGGPVRGSPYLPRVEVGGEGTVRKDRACVRDVQERRCRCVGEKREGVLEWLLG